MKIKIIKLLIISIIVFIIGIFFISLNKSSLYNTKGLEGQVLKDVKLEYFNTSKFILEKDLRENKIFLILIMSF